MRAGARMQALAAVAFACLCSTSVAAQNILEFRFADTKYRYADWNYTFPNAVVVDLFYVGVPGSNEFNLGGGYTFKAGKLAVTPLVYAVIGKEQSQRGVKIALLVLYERAGWKLNAFVGHYAHVSGGVPSYQVMDTVDVTRVFAGRWEAGISNGFFHADGKWNPQIGPLVKFNDRWGSWAASYRFGPQQEFRAGRLFAF